MCKLVIQEHKHPHGVADKPDNLERIWVCEECECIFTDEEIRKDVVSENWGHSCKYKKECRCESHLEPYLPDFSRKMSECCDKPEKCIHYGNPLLPDGSKCDCLCHQVKKGDKTELEFDIEKWIEANVFHTTLCDKQRIHSFVCTCGKTVCVAEIDRLRAENKRLDKEWNECHQTNSELCMEHIELKTQIAEMKKMIYFINGCLGGGTAKGRPMDLIDNKSWAIWQKFLQTLKAAQCPK